MKKLFIFIFSFIILLSFSSKTAKAAIPDPDKQHVRITSIEIKPIANFPTAIEKIYFQTSTGEPVEINTKFGSCNGNPYTSDCSEYYDVLTSDKTTAVELKIRAVYRYVNSVVDNNGHYVLTNSSGTTNEGDATTYLKSVYPGHQTGTIFLKWIPVVGIPELTLVSPPVLSKNGTSFYLDAKLNPPLGPKYIVKLTRNLSDFSSSHSFILSCDNYVASNKCDPKNNSFPDIFHNPSYDYTTKDPPVLSVEIKTDSNDMLNNYSYTLTIENAIGAKSSQSFTIADFSNTGPLNITITPDTVSQEAIDSTSVEIKIVNGVKDQEYSITLNKKEGFFSSGEAQRVITPRFKCSGPNCTYTLSNTKLKDLSLPPGIYPLTVTALADSKIFGRKPFTIAGTPGGIVTPTEPNTPTPPGPPCHKFVDPDNPSVVINPSDIPKDPKLKYKCAEFETGLGIIGTDPMDFAKKIFSILLSLSGGIAMLIIIFSGYRYMTAAGDQAKIQGAKETLTSAIVGLLFIIFSFVILEVIGVDILHIPGFGR